EQSLLLRKPLLELPHRGGLVLRRGTPEYTILSGWLAQGAPGPNANDPHVIKLDVETRQAKTRLVASLRGWIFPPHAALQLRVLARFSDGSTRDVTHWTRFATNDEMIATVRPDGAVQMTGEGETAITVAYQDRVAFARLAVPFSFEMSGRVRTPTLL